MMASRGMGDVNPTKLKATRKKGSKTPVNKPAAKDVAKAAPYGNKGK